MYWLVLIGSMTVKIKNAIMELVKREYFFYSEFEEEDDDDDEYEEDESDDEIVEVSNKT